MMALLAARLDYEPAKVPAQMQKVFDAGHEAEDKAIAALEARGFKIIDQQMPVRLPITKTIEVRGHIDGHFCVEHRSVAVCEIKSQSQDEWDRYERGDRTALWERYDWQFSTYRHASGLPVRLVRYNRDTGETSIPKPIEARYSVEDIRVRVLEVERAARTGTLNLPCTLQYPCAYFYLHEDATDYIEDETIDVLARQYKTGKRIESVGKEQAQRARNALHAVVESRGPGQGMKIGPTKGGSKVTFYTETRVNEIRGPRDRNDPFQLEQEIEKVRVTVKEGEG